MPRLFRLIALACMLALLGVACGEQKDTGFPEPKPEETTSHGASATAGPVALTGPIEIVDSAFEPKEAKVTAGTEVVWEQSGSAPHNVVADDGSFVSNPKCATDATTCMTKGDEFRFTFKKAGEFAYYCVIHGGKGGQGMSGTVIVE
jgi:plastocyanin